MFQKSISVIKQNKANKQTNDNNNTEKIDFTSNPGRVKMLYSMSF
jgi:hypothetical protein